MINSATATAHSEDPSLIVQYAPLDSGLSKKLALSSGLMQRLTRVFAGRTYIVVLSVLSDSVNDIVNHTSDMGTLY